MQILPFHSTHTKTQKLFLHFFLLFTLLPPLTFFSTANISHSLFFRLFLLPKDSWVRHDFSLLQLYTLTTSTQNSFTHFQSVTSCGVQRSSVELCLRSVPRYHRNISRYFWNHIELNSRRVHPTTIRVRQNMGTTLPVVTSTFLKKVEKPFLQVRSNSAELSRSSPEFSRFMARKCSKIS